MNTCRLLVTFFCKLTFALSATVAFAAGGVMTGIEVNDLTADKQEVKLTFSEPIAASPASFSVGTPPRLAFDFQGIDNQTGKNTISVNHRIIKSISIAKASDRTRLMLTLQRQATYDTKVDGKTVLITLSDTASSSESDPSALDSSVAPAPLVHFSSAEPGARIAGIQKVDFRRGPGGEGKVLVDLSGVNAGIDIRQRGKNLVVDFGKAALPKVLEKRLDVSDFGTPISKIDVIKENGSTRLLIEPTGDWEYSAYQAENHFAIEVRKKVDTAATTANWGNQQPLYKGKQLSLNFQNVEVRTVLQVIAEFTGLNIIASDTVSGSLTLRLKDVPWDQALDIILQSKNLSQRKVGNVLWVAPRDEFADKDKQELEAKKQIADLEPTRTEYFRLKYAKAEAISDIFKDEKNRILSPRGSAIIDSRTNTLVIQDVSSKLVEMRELINKIDIPSRQVLIEARIVEATDKFSRELGFKVQRSLKPDATSTNNYTLTSALGASPIDGTQPGVLTANFGSIFNGVIQLELSALESDGQGKVISSPRLVTADRVEAIIENGVQVPYTTSAPNGATTVTYQNATLSLKVTPQITPDGNVLMDVKINNDSLGQSVQNAGYAINTKTITTRVEVDNGGTVMIGGIYTYEKQGNYQGVPLLHKLPILGNLFKHRMSLDKKSELLIFITPRVLHSNMITPS